jgi:hypothetical protein
VASVRVCDLHDLDQWWVVVEATREFELDGARYEIDLCVEHVVAFDEVMEPYVRGARRLRRGQAGRRSSR